MLLLLTVVKIHKRTDPEDFEKEITEEQESEVLVNPTDIARVYFKERRGLTRIFVKYQDIEGNGELEWLVREGKEYFDKSGIII